MIIWGSRGITSTAQQQNFHCPRCDQQRTADLKQVRNFFTLYFIPIIPLNVAGRYVQCSSCAGTFEEEILNFDPEQDKQEREQQMLRVMVMAALADGVVDDHERAEIKKQYQEFAGLPLSAAVLDQEVGMATQSGADLNSYVGSFADELSGHGKAYLVKLAFHTMSANGDLKPGHQDQLMKLAVTLGIPQDQYLELISGISELE